MAKELDGEFIFGYNGKGVNLLKRLKIVEKLKKPSASALTKLELRDEIEVRYSLKPQFKAGTAEVSVYLVGKFDVNDFDNPIEVEEKLIEGKAAHIMKHLQKFSYDELK